MNLLCVNGANMGLLAASYYSPFATSVVNFVMGTTPKRQPTPRTMAVTVGFLRQPQRLLQQIIESTSGNARRLSTLEEARNFFHVSVIEGLPENDVPPTVRFAHIVNLTGLVPSREYGVSRYFGEVVEAMKQRLGLVIE